jgi:hypothetical protein
MSRAMSPPRMVVYATHRPFRLHCDALLREAGVLVRLASRQAELAKALGDGTTAAIIVGDDRRDADVARELVDARPATLGPPVPIMQRAPSESIEEIVARALAVMTSPTDQPRSSE